MIIFQQEYDGESIYDLDRDVSEALQGDYNPIIDGLPVDENGIQLGTFKVTITWELDDERS